MASSDKPTSRELPPRDKPINLDWLIKSALRQFYPDLAMWLIGERPIAVEALDTAEVVTSGRFSDKVLHLHFASRPPLLLHVEFQSGGDKIMPERMTEYFAFLLRTLELASEEGTRFAAFVIYLDPASYRDDPGFFRLEGEFGFEVLVNYSVVKLWELSPEPFLAMESPGLLPFVPLMSGQPEALLVKSAQRIASAPEAVAGAETKRDLLTILGGLASRVIKDKQTIWRLLSEVRLMGDNYFFDLIRDEGHALGLVEGRVEGLEKGFQESLLQVLAARFGEVPLDICRRIEGIGEVDDLKDLVRHAASCTDLASFREALGNR